MNTKNVIVSGLVGAIVLFLLGWVFYGMLLAGFFEANQGTATGVAREPNLGLIFLGNVAAGILLAFIFDKWAGIKTFGAGFKGGAIIGLLTGLYFDLIMLATTNMMNSTALIADVLVSTIMMAIAGGVIGAVLGKMTKSV